MERCDLFRHHGKRAIAYEASVTSVMAEIKSSSDRHSGVADERAPSDGRSQSGRSSNRSSCTKPDMLSEPQRTGGQAIARQDERDAIEPTDYREHAAEYRGECHGRMLGRFRRHLPLVRITQVPPLLDVSAHLVDDRRGVVGLRRGGKPKALVEQEGCLRRRLALLRLRDRGDEFRAAAVLDDLLRRLPGVVEFPMLPWACVGGVYDGMVEEWIGHENAPWDGDCPTPPALGDLGESLYERPSILGASHAGGAPVSPTSSSYSTAATCEPPASRHRKKDAI